MDENKYIETATDKNVEGIEFYGYEKYGIKYLCTSIPSEKAILASYEEVKHAFEMNDIVIVDNLNNNFEKELYRPIACLFVNEGGYENVVVVISYFNSESSTMEYAMYYSNYKGSETNDADELFPSGGDDQ